MESQIIKTKPDFFQVQNFVTYHIDRMETMAKAFDIHKIDEKGDRIIINILSNISIGQYKKLLALSFNRKFVELKEMLYQLKVPTINN